MVTVSGRAAGALRGGAMRIPLSIVTLLAAAVSFGCASSLDASVGGTPPAGATAGGSAVAASQIKPVVSSVSSPVKRGGDAILHLKTTPNQSCTLDYVAPAGTPNSSAGLGSQTADKNGTISWIWTIAGNAATGAWKLKVTCGTQTATADIQVVA